MWVHLARKKADTSVGPEDSRICGVSGGEKTSLDPLRGERGRKRLSPNSQVTRSSREATLLDSNRVFLLIHGTRGRLPTQFAKYEGS